eukprot:CAMPEP_0194382142 /NCGR_PEP_ID=MMETSP0174-20130528/58355_1 /TAXON_ID=216777 /ORGANISM="Proboscia alata, Strain PI-D3" /LENGTH=704 /DNA_ID=CAMNT_0039167197 /DNA_START=94 /DNA_END=2208 /DNA_ORIENTATION=+
MPHRVHTHAYTSHFVTAVPSAYHPESTHPPIWMNTGRVTRSQSRGGIHSFVDAARSNTGLMRSPTSHVPSSSSPTGTNQHSPVDLVSPSNVMMPNSRQHEAYRPLFVSSQNIGVPAGGTVSAQSHPMYVNSTYDDPVNNSDFRYSVYDPSPVPANGWGDRGSIRMRNYPQFRTDRAENDVISRADTPHPHDMDASAVSVGMSSGSDDTLDTSISSAAPSAIPSSTTLHPSQNLRRSKRRGATEATGSAANNAVSAFDDLQNIQHVPRRSARNRRKITLFETNEKVVPCSVSIVDDKKRASSPTTEISMCTIHSCCICQDEPSKHELAKINCCQHKFCFNCIEKWSERENTCPLCKARFAKIERVNRPPTKKRKKGDESVGNGVRTKNSKKVKNRDQRSDVTGTINHLEGLFAGLEHNHNVPLGLPTSLASILFQGINRVAGVTDLSNLNNDIVTISNNLTRGANSTISSRGGGRSRASSRSSSSHRHNMSISMRIRPPRPPGDDQDRFSHNRPVRVSAPPPPSSGQSFAMRGGPLHLHIDDQSGGGPSWQPRYHDTGMGVGQDVNVAGEHQMYFSSTPPSLSPPSHHGSGIADINGRGVLTGDSVADSFADRVRNLNRERESILQRLDGHPSNTSAGSTASTSQSIMDPFLVMQAQEQYPPRSYAANSSQLGAGITASMPLEIDDSDDENMENDDIVEVVASVL